MAMPMRKRGGTGLTKSLLELLPPTWAEAKSLSGGIMEPFWVGESSIRVEQYIYARIYLVDGGRDMGTQPRKKITSGEWERVAYVETYLGLRRLEK